jgi:hypothetical protein
MRALAAVVGTGVVDGPELEGAGVPIFDEARLRRMDRFGRAGFLAGSLALRDAGLERGADADPRTGFVLGTAFGCRDAVTRHTHLLAETTRVEDLSPSLFTQTVHNTVVGELAIEWRIGGVSEVLVSGRTAGLEALLRAAAHVADGTAERVAGVGAEGLDPEMEAAWTEERARYGAGAERVAALEGGAALVLAPLETFARARILGGTVFCEPDAGRVAARLAPFVESLTNGARPVLLLATPALDGAFEKAPRARAGLQELGITRAPEVERFAAAGPRAVVDLVRAGTPGVTVVVVRDPDGPVAAVGVEITARNA